MRRSAKYQYIWILGVCLMIAFTAGVSPAQVHKVGLDMSIARCEQAITYATKMFEQGKLKKGKPIVAKINPKLTMKISAESFEADVEKVWGEYYKFVSARMELVAKNSSQKKRVKKVVKKKSRLEMMREAEEKTVALSPAPTGAAPLNYDVYDDYQASRQERISAESQAAESDIRTVIAERQAADIEAQQRLSRKGQLQAQSSMWQAELDKQASASARATAQWNAEHSAGGYARKFLGTVIQTTVGAFTAGLFGTVGYNAANRAVEQWFPGQSNSSPASGPPPGGAGGPSGAGGSGNQNPQY